MTKISIIIPIYNVEKYIQKCIYSLLDQTINDIEIICVDDKGSDGSMAIVNDIQRTHPKGNLISVIEMPHNSGAAAARNEGIKAATGKYLAFVDSDDWCEPTMYDKLFAEAERLQTDWCYSYAVKEFADGHQEELRQPKVVVGELTPDMRKFIFSHFVAYFWTSIYRRDFILAYNLFFPPYKFSEDSYFVWMVVMHARSLSYVNEFFYHYRILSNSVSNTYDPNKGKQKIEVFSLLINKLKEENLYSQYEEELNYLFIKKGLLIPLCIAAIGPKKMMKKNIIELLKMGLQVVPKYKQNIYFRHDKKTNYLLRIFIRCPRFAAFVFRIYVKFNHKVIL